MYYQKEDPEKLAFKLGYCGEYTRKAILPSKTLDIIYKRRFVPNTSYYFSNRKHAIDNLEKVEKSRKERYFKKPPSDKLLSYIKYSDRKDLIHRKRQLKYPVQFKLNERFTASKNISQRLFIPEPGDNVRTVIDIQPEFYSSVEGRPLRALDDIKVYIKNIRDYAMYRSQIGYRRDMELRLTRNMSEELAEHDKINDKLKSHVHDFQIFLTEDYKEANALVAHSEKIMKSVVSVQNEMLRRAFELNTINNIIYKLDSIRNILKSYKTFLNFVAPVSWRKQNDENMRDSVCLIEFGTEFATDTDLIETMNIDKIIDSARPELENQPPISMYFKYPEEIMYLFRTMELQSREYIVQLNIAHGPYRILKDSIKTLKKGAQDAEVYFLYIIDRFEKAIQREMSNMEYLEERFFKILGDAFFDSVASPDVLKLTICLDFVYMQLFGKGGGHGNLRDPAKILEIMYEYQNLMLDKLDFHIVKEAIKENYASDLQMMLKAKKAQKELKAFREMTASFKRAFLPPAKFKRPEKVKFVDKKTLVAQARAERLRRRIESGERKKTKKFHVSETEKEALLAFTEWCEGTDPAPYLKEYETYVKPVLEMTKPEINSFDTIH